MKYLQPSGRCYGAMLIVVILMLTLASLVLHAVSSRAGDQFQLIDMQITADAIAISLARIQAASLSTLTQLNKRLRRCHQLADQLIQSWLALQQCRAACVVAVGCVCLAAAQYFDLHAPRFLTRLSQVANTLESSQQTLLARLPFFLKAQAQQLARHNRVELIAIALHGTRSPRALLVNRGQDRQFPLGYHLPALLRTDSNFDLKQRVEVILRSETANAHQAQIGSARAQPMPWSAQFSNNAERLAGRSWQPRLVP